MEHSFRVHVVAMIPFSAGRADLRLLSGDAFSVCKKRSPIVLPNFRAQTLFACYRKDARIRQHIISGVCNSHCREARKIKLKKQKR